MTYNITINKLDKYSFEGTIDLDGIMHPVAGDFNIYLEEEDYAYCEIDLIQLRIGNKWIKLNLDRLNIEDLEEYIVSKGDVWGWHADKQADLIDYYYDMYKEEGI